MAVRPGLPPAPAPPPAPTPLRAGSRDVCRWDAAAVMFFPRPSRTDGPDRPCGPDREAGPTVERTAGATAADVGGPGRG